MPAEREAGREHDGVLLGDADVVEPVGELGLEVLEPGALRHGGGDRHDARIAPRLAHERPAEGLGVGRARRAAACARRCSA